MLVYICLKIVNYFFYRFAHQVFSLIITRTVVIIIELLYIHASEVKGVRFLLIKIK